MAGFFCLDFAFLSDAFASAAFGAAVIRSFSIS
jgi:hypothetical protein